MTPLIIFKTRNGYILVEHQGMMPVLDPAKTHSCSSLGERWRSTGDSVADVLKAHFEPPESVIEEEKAA